MIWKWHPITFAIVYSLEASHRCCPYLRGGDNTEEWIPGGGNYWESPEGVSATTDYCFGRFFASFFFFLLFFPLVHLQELCELNKWTLCLPHKEPIQYIFDKLIKTSWLSYHSFYTLPASATVTLSVRCRIRFPYLESWAGSNHRQNLIEIHGWVRILIWTWLEIALTLIYVKMSQRSSAKSKPAMRLQEGEQGRYSTCFSGRCTWSLGNELVRWVCSLFACKDINIPKDLMSLGDAIHSAPH